ncbi:hypothetical protein Tco_1255123 [Tanacetum coccineum]
MKKSVNGCGNKELVLLLTLVLTADPTLVLTTLRLLSTIPTVSLKMERTWQDQFDLEATCQKLILNDKGKWVQAELDEEARLERQRQEQASLNYIANLYDEVQARIDADHELAVR